MTLLLLSLIAFPAVGQDSSAFTDFAGRVEAERIKWGAPGLGIAVVHDDRVVFQGGFGVRSLATGEPVDENTLFHVGSTTKAFAAAALGILADEGGIGWNDRIIDHMPGFRVADPYVTLELNVVDILTHRSGIEGTDLAWVLGMTPDEVVARLPHAGQAAPFRTVWAYNNGMYVLSGELVEAVSGQPFTSFVRERIFSPLGMDRTTGPVEEIAQRSNVAISHAMVDGEMTPIGLTDQYQTGAAGSFYSSAADYSAWLRMWLNEGRFEDRQILSPESVGMAFTPHMVLPGTGIYPAAREAGAHMLAYGLAWFLQTYRGERVVMHTGSIDGMSAIVGLMPDHELGMVAFINADHIELRHALMYEVFDRVLGGERRDWSTDLKVLFDGLHEQAEAAQAKARAAAKGNGDPALPLERYAGLYRHPLFGDFRVALNDGQLRLEAGRLWRLGLDPVGAHRFRTVRDDGRGSGFVLSFGTDGANRPDTLHFWGNEAVRVEE
jgi:CubicO group peptidase (beta-lactamase class C family)